MRAVRRLQAHQLRDVLPMLRIHGTRWSAGDEERHVRLEKYLPWQ